MTPDDPVGLGLDEGLVVRHVGVAEMRPPGLQLAELDLEV